MKPAIARERRRVKLLCHGLLVLDSRTKGDEVARLVASGIICSYSYLYIKELMQMPPSISLIIPAFDEAGTIEGVVRAAVNSGLFLEVIVIDDGS